VVFWFPCLVLKVFESEGVMRDISLYLKENTRFWLPLGQPKLLPFGDGLGGPYVFCRVFNDKNGGEVGSIYVYAGRVDSERGIVLTVGTCAEKSDSHRGDIIVGDLKTVRNYLYEDQVQKVVQDYENAFLATGKWVEGLKSFEDYEKNGFPKKLGGLTPIA
jgi:hypothetical protein